MSFLLRFTLLLALVCVLIPTGMQTTEEARIDGTQAMTLARAAVSDASGFCERQPDACSAGNKIATALLYKIEAGARSLFDLVSEFISDKWNNKSAETGAPPHKTVTPQRSASPLGPDGSHGTLVPADRKPAWHGPLSLQTSGQSPAQEQEK